jgi:hypothetical protein
MANMISDERIRFITFFKTFKPFSDYLSFEKRKPLALIRVSTPRIKITCQIH